MTPEIRTLVDEARRLVSLCRHAVDVNDPMALAEMSLEAQRRVAKLHELAKVAALTKARAELHR